ncbi:MAG: hypothetical protein ACLRXZ_00545 [Alistipes finegoldii]|uniref:hypothetical protein n=1 Tax=Alistipes finegoldii TaxID=214856 RepID=UPI0039A0F995
MQKAAQKGAAFPLHECADAKAGVLRRVLFRTTGFIPEWSLPDFSAVERGVSAAA